MKKKAIAASALTAMALFGASQQAHADAKLIPAVKAGNGWVTVVSYVNTTPPDGVPPQVFVHATYQVKNPNNFTDKCIHLDGQSLTTQNDLTTTVISTVGGGIGTVFPVTDTVGSALINPPITPGNPQTEGFLLITNYDGKGKSGKDGELTVEAIVFNLDAGFLYSQRGLELTQIALDNAQIEPDAPGPAGTNTLQGFPYSAGASTSTCTGASINCALSRFLFLPPATATTGLYVIATNRPGTKEAAAAEPASTTGLGSAIYDARIQLQFLRDAAHGYAEGVYNRLEDFRSIANRVELICLAQIGPSLIWPTIPGFIADGGWANVSPRCRETEDGGVTYQQCDGDATGREVGDSAIVYKVEFARGYGYAVTPMHPQYYTK